MDKNILFLGIAAAAFAAGYALMKKYSVTLAANPGVAALTYIPAYTPAIEPVSPWAKDFAISATRRDVATPIYYGSIN